MRRHLALPLLFALTAVFAAQSAHAQDTASVEATIAAAFAGSAAAWNDADSDGHVAIYADSAAFMTGEGPAIGRERTAEILERAFFRDGAPAQQLRFEHLTVTMLGEDHALATGHFILSGGGMDDNTGWFTTIWQRIDDGWRIIHDHSS
jgi:uncharacterized protein (TIGR02246 family)